MVEDILLFKIEESYLEYLKQNIKDLDFMKFTDLISTGDINCDDDILTAISSTSLSELREIIGYSGELGIILKDQDLDNISAATDRLELQMQLEDLFNGEFYVAYLG